MKIPKREEGQGLVEYALILVLVAVIIIAILTILGSSVMVVYARVIGGLNGQVVTGQGREAVVTGYDANTTQGTGTCGAVISNVTVIGLEDGALARSGTVPIDIIVNSTVRTYQVNISDSGTGTYAGPVTVTGVGSGCTVRVVGG